MIHKERNAQVKAGKVSAIQQLGGMVPYYLISIENTLQACDHPVMHSLSRGSYHDDELR